MNYEPKAPCDICKKSFYYKSFWVIPIDGIRMCDMCCDMYYNNKEASLFNIENYLFERDEDE